MNPLEPKPGEVVIRLSQQAEYRLAQMSMIYPTKSTLKSLLAQGLVHKVEDGYCITALGGKIQAALAWTTAKRFFIGRLLRVERK